MLSHRVFETTDIHRVLNMKLREIDQIEVIGSTGLPVREAIEFSIHASSMVYVIEKEEKIVGVWGYVGIGAEGFCVPWLLQSAALLEDKRDRISFARESALVVDELFKMCPFMFNFVSTENEEAQEWLRWLGFKVHDHKVIYLHSNSPFFMFTKGETSCATQLLRLQ